MPPSPPSISPPGSGSRKRGAVVNTMKFWMALAVLLAAPAAVAAPGQITVAATSMSGDWGTGVDSDYESARVRFLWGRKTRLSGELGVWSVRSVGPLIVQTPFGPVAAGQRPTPGAGPGPGTGPGSNGASGSGSGGSSGSTTAPGEPETVTLAEERFRGLSDLRLGLERTLLGGGERLFRLDAELGVKVPTADEEDFLGTGEWDYRIGLAGEYELWSGRVFAGVGWNRLGDPDWAVLEDVLDAHLGMASDPLAGGLVVGGWLEANQEVLAGAGGRSAAGLSVRGGGRLRWRLELTAGLSSAAEDLSVSFGVSFGTSGGATGGMARRG